MTRKSLGQIAYKNYNARKGNAGVWPIMGGYAVTEMEAWQAAADAVAAVVRAETIEECALAAGQAAWKHEGDDAYSRGKDDGAVHQVQECVKAIRALDKEGTEP
jgi:hypothetical protein